MISKKPFGRTGHKTTRAIFGGAAFFEANREQTEKVLETLLDYGVNHIDTSINYGESEDHIGLWMEDHREDFFLATKTGSRTYEGAKEDIQRSLERLKVDRIDLLQLHNLIDREEWKTVFEDNGAIEALIEAREEGLVKYLGVTGHSLKAPEIHMRSLEKFDFDSVLLPLNYPLMRNPDYRKSFNGLLQTCKKRNVAVQTIKSIARRRYGDREQTRDTWYEPLEKREEIDKAVHWVLGHSYVFLNTVADSDLLPKVLDSADRFEEEVPSDEEMERQMERLDMRPLWPE